MSQIPLAHPLRPLHLYRHLLREASYLPSIARPHISDRIRSRFRSTRDNLKSFQWTGKPDKTLENAARETQRRTKAALWEGCRHLRRLRAANAGDVARMLRILRVAFGRLGKRRRELLNDLLHQDPPADTAALEARLGKLTIAETATDKLTTGKKELPLKPRTPDHWDTANLILYLRSQKRQQDHTTPASWPRTLLTNTNPERGLDQLMTILDQPMPERRLRIRREKWWKTAAERLMPPLAKPEWHLLAQAARGDLPADQYKTLPRRPVAQSGSVPTEQTQKTWNWNSYAEKPAFFVERPRAGRNSRVVDLPDVGPYGTNPQSRVRALSGRQLRRQYLNLWESCSFAEQDPTTLKKSFQWGTRKRVPTASPIQLKLCIASIDPTEPNLDVKKAGK
ncbi:hypothetical protein ACHAQA_006461 [Verticillium albo-atrum]